MRQCIDHPDYQYSQSKNPYAEKLKTLSSNVYLDNDAEKQKGTWRLQFLPNTEQRNDSLHVEIGCNAGHVILEWACRQKDQYFIGIDWKFKPIFRAADKAKRKGIENLKFIRAHAERLPFLFGPHEIDHLYLFFPDPWPKKAHWKNRYIHVKRLQDIGKLMKPNGIFHIKTDHAEYFDWILTATSQVSDVWEVTEMTKDLHKNHPQPKQLKIPDVTLFESLFIRDGIPIQSIKLRKI